MRLILLILSLLLLNNTLIISQDYIETTKRRKKLSRFTPRYPLELGFHIGTSMFLGDLGGTTEVGRSFTTDLNASAIRPTVGFFARYSMGGNFSFRLEMAYMMFSGDDRKIGNGEFVGYQYGYKDGWFRFYRNLHFQTHVFELTNSTEFTPYNFKLSGSLYSRTRQNVLSPYFVLGIGFIAFNPEAEYNGKWVSLQPLSTEGQGIIDGTKPYSLVQFIIPVGFGIRWEHDHSWVLSLEINHRFTFTDYIDDVSTNYVDPSIYDGYFGQSTAQKAKALARRSEEIDPENIYGHITSPGHKRGDVKDNDAYYTIAIRMAFYLKRSRPLALIKDY